MGYRALVLPLFGFLLKTDMDMLLLLMLGSILKIVVDPAIELVEGRGMNLMTGKEKSLERELKTPVKCVGGRMLYERTRITLSINSKCLDAAYISKNLLPM